MAAAQPQGLFGTPVRTMCEDTLGGHDRPGHKATQHVTLHVKGGKHKKVK